MKNKVTVWTQQDALELLVDTVHQNFVVPFTTHRATKHLGTEEQYVGIVKALKALPRPLVVASVQRVLKEGGMDKGWWYKNDYRPVCDLCEEPRTWVLLVHDTCYCEIQGIEEKEAIYICPLCVARLGTEVLKYEQDT